MDTRLTTLMPTQVTRVAAISSPAVTFMTTNLVDHTLTGVFMFYCTDHTEHMLYLHTCNQMVSHTAQ